MADEAPQEIQVPVVWVGAEDLPVQFINQIVGVVQPGEVFLTVGTVVPPAIFGTPEEQKAQAEAIQFVQVRPAARLALSPERLREFIAILQKTLENYEKLEGKRS